MNKNPMNDSEEDFEIMGDLPKEDPVIAKRRLLRENQITKKLGEYLLKGYCMLGDTCQDCNCILLRTTEQNLFCVGCDEIDVEKKKVESEEPMKKKKKKAKGKKEPVHEISNCNQLENKLKWAVDELTKSQSPNRINEMCSVVIKLTETIQALKAHEMTSTEK